MPDQQPTPDQSFSIHLKSLQDFADEFTTQIGSIQGPMDHLATMSGTPPQYGAFAEAWSLGAGEQAAIEEMYSLLGQVKQAIGFAGDVTGTVAEGYKKADENISSALGGPPAPGSTSHEGGSPIVDNPWQDAQVTGTQVTYPDQGAQGGQGSNPPVAPPMPGTPMTAPPATGTVSNVVTGVVTTGAVAAGALLGAKVTGGPLPVWTPPPAPAPTGAPGAPSAPGASSSAPGASGASGADSAASTAAPVAAPASAPAPAPAPATAPAPASAPAPAPSWTDYFQGTPQGGA